MNKAIYIRLPEEFRVLYELSSKKNIDINLRKELRYKVQDLRADKDGKKDLLQEKLRRFGNQGRWGKDKLSELEQLIFDSKSPGKDGIGEWVSVEIECILPDSQAERKFVKLIRGKCLSNFVTLKDDASLNPTHEEGCDSHHDDDDSGECWCGASQQYGKEIVVTFKFGEWNTLQTVCEGLKSIGATVNKTCGLHIHFDCRNKTGRQVTTLGKRLARCVPALKQLLPQSRQNNKYCRQVINKHRGGDRYAFVNLKSFQRHQTLEVRGHSGTVDVDKIINWIKILKIIMEKKGIAEVKDVPALILMFGFPVELSDYIVSRYEKFKTANENTVEDDVTEDEMVRLPIAAVRDRTLQREPMNYTLTFGQAATLSVEEFRRLYYNNVPLEVTPINYNLNVNLESEELEDVA